MTADSIRKVFFIITCTAIKISVSLSRLFIEAIAKYVWTAVRLRPPPPVPTDELSVFPNDTVSCILNAGGGQSLRAVADYQRQALGVFGFDSINRVGENNQP